MSDDRRHGMDDMALLVGELKGHVERTRSQVSDIYKKLDETSKAMNSLVASVDTNTAKVSGLLEAHDKQQQKHDTRIESLETSRSRLRYTLALVFGGSGSIGGILGNWLSKFGGVPHP